MLEILITLFLLTMWLLASAGVQSSSLQFNKSAQFRTQAVYLATELAERMQANKTAAVAGTYVYSGDTGTSSTNCTSAICSPDALAAFDLAEWSGRVTAVLPNASVSVSTAAVANPITYTILISWSDRRTDRTYASTGTAESFSYTATKSIFDPPI
jgi:type IV pilus assembly protein PilV